MDTIVLTSLRTVNGSLKENMPLITLVTDSINLAFEPERGQKLFPSRGGLRLKLICHCHGDINSALVKPSVYVCKVDVALQIACSANSGLGILDWTYFIIFTRRK